jgi:KDO2-lipid IV(A) lauroyltransferase
MKNLKTNAHPANNLQNKTRQKHSPLPAIIYYIAIPFIYLISWLPFRILYLVSDFLYVIIFYCIGYRKKVVLLNLHNSFPEKTEEEVQRICKDYYRNFCDLFLETIKLLTISRKELLKRCKFNPQALELFSKLADEQKSVIMVLGHQGNWEWACNSFNISCRQQLYVIYHPISNKFFDGLMYRIRTRNGTKLIPMNSTYREMAHHKNELNATAFVADQTPQPDHAYWVTFLNQDTPVFKGVEVIAKKMNLPVVYTAVKKIKRGYYEMHAELVTEHPEVTANGELSEIYTRKLEKDIKAQPGTWLWSHKRWKHKRTKEYQLTGTTV